MTIELLGCLLRIGSVPNKDRTRGSTRCDVSSFGTETDFGVHTARTKLQVTKRGNPHERTSIDQSQTVVHGWSQRRDAPEPLGEIWTCDTSTVYVFTLLHRWVRKSQNRSPESLDSSQWCFRPLWRLYRYPEGQWRCLYTYLYWCPDLDRSIGGRCDDISRVGWKFDDMIFPRWPVILCLVRWVRVTCLCKKCLSDE